MPEEAEERERAGLRKSLLRWAPLILVVIVLICIGLLVGLSAVRAAPEQPIAYSHRSHVQNGIQCLYCHSEATRSQIAGIPSVQKCMGCHTVMATENEVVQALTGYWERDEPIPWKRVNDQPDFVYFSHQPHVGAGLSCESCHGNVGEMEAAEATVRMDMGWCINCHELQEAEKVNRLIDCMTCHK